MIQVGSQKFVTLPLTFADRLPTFCVKNGWLTMLASCGCPVKFVNVLAKTSIAKSMSSLLAQSSRRWLTPLRYMTKSKACCTDQPLRRGHGLLLAVNSVFRHNPLLQSVADSKEHSSVAHATLGCMRVLPSQRACRAVGCMPRPCRSSFLQNPRGMYSLGHGF